MASAQNTLCEGFEYAFSRVDPVGGAHIDPPAAAVYETLVAKGDNGEAIPFMASRWDCDAEGIECRFEFRPGLRFHSGAPCDARAVAKALERCRWGDNRTRQMQYFDVVDTIAEDGPGTVVIRTHFPTARLMQALWGTHSAIFNENARAGNLARYGMDMADGTGPYRLDSWSPEKVVAVRAETYSNASLPMFAGRGDVFAAERIEWLCLRSEDERLKALYDGRVDFLHAPPAHRFEELAADPRFDAAVTPQPSSVYLGLNFARRDLGFDDLAVRRAVSMAIDRKSIVDQVVAGLGTATYGAVPPGAEFHDGTVEASGRHDPAAAARLLEDAGWALGEHGLRYRHGVALSFECVVQDDSVLHATARLVAAQLRHIGVEMSVEVAEPFAPFYKRIGTGPASFLSKWLWPDPIDALAGFTMTGCQPRPNWQRASIPRLDLAFDRFRRAPDRAGTEESARDIQHLIAENLPLIPLFAPFDLWVNRIGVHGWRPRPGHLYPYYQDIVLERAA